MALSSSDLKQIQSLLLQQAKISEKKSNENLEQKFREQDKKFDYKLQSQKEEILDEIDIKLTDFRSDFYTKIDPILKEVLSAQEARTLLENRLEALEDIHQTGNHSLSNL